MAITLPGPWHIAHGSSHIRMLWALSPCGALGTLSLTLAQWFSFTQEFPVGSVITVGVHALNRGDVGAPRALHHCETVRAANVLQELGIFKSNATGGISQTLMYLGIT